MHVKKILMGILAITLLSTLCSAGDFSFSGAFTNANQVQYFTFTVTSGSKVVIQSYGYGGGTNAAGVAVQRGGFDPSIVLFRGTDSSAAVFKTTDDEYGCAQGTRDTVTNVCYDVYWEGTSQPTAGNAPVVAFEPGRYVVALTNYGNFNNGLTLGEGFSNTGSGFTCAGVSRTVAAGAFTDCTGNARDGHWALDIKGVETAQLGIVKPKLMIAASDATRTYGAANPAFAGTITGLENGDVISATYASTADATSSVGNYSIVPTLVDPAGKIANYDAMVTNGTLTITPAPLGVAAADANRFVGQLNPAFTGTIAGVQNGDAITATYSTTATSTSAAGAYPIIPALVDPGGKLANYTVTVTNAVLTVNPAAAPQVVSVTPNAGSGMSSVFSVAYSDGAGFAQIASTRTIINTAVSNAKACGVLYTAVGSTLAITNDAGTAYMTPTKLGTATVIENSQCSVNLAASSATGAGTTLTLKLSVSFKSAFAGAKNVYAFAQDKAGNSSGWQSRGTWSIPQGAPSVVSVSPSGGTGTVQSFQLTYSDAGGFAAITSTRTIFNTGISNAKACGVLYTAGGSTLAITNDAGTAYVTPTKLGSPAVIENSQCSVDVANSWVVGTGNTLTLNLAITFKAPFTGAKGIFGLVQNKFGLDSGWQNRGTWAP